mgnify:CR=1 FL=1
MHTNSRALSIIELLVVVAILGTIILIFSAGFIQNREEAEVKRAADSLSATLSLARSRTVASQNLSSWGVHFEQSQFTLFQGTTFAVTAPANEISVLDSRVKLQNIA